MRAKHDEKAHRKCKDHCVWLDPSPEGEEDQWALLRELARRAEAAAYYSEYTRGWANALFDVLGKLAGEHPTFLEHPGVYGDWYESDALKAKFAPNMHHLPEPRNGG